MTQPSVKVLISAPSLDTGRNVSGVSSVVRNIISALSPAVAFEHVLLGAAAANSNLFTRFAQAFMALLKVARPNYAAYHSNTALNTKSIVRDFCVTMVAALSRHRVILHLHGGQYLFERPNAVIRLLVRAMARVATDIVVLSEMEVGAFQAIYGNYPLKVIFNGSVPAANRQPANVGADTCRFLFMGRFVPEKGLETLIEAISAMAPSRNISFCFYGSGPMLSDLNALSALRSDVCVRAPFAPHALPQILAEADVLVLPSLNGEGMPMAVIEAMHAGVVPLCTRIASIPEIVVHNTTGILIEPKSVKQLVAAIQTLSSVRSEREALSAAAVSFARQNLDSDSNYRKLKPLYSA